MTKMLFLVYINLKISKGKVYSQYFSTNFYLLFSVVISVKLIVF